jgi:hypothetical protein
MLPRVAFQGRRQDSTHRETEPREGRKGSGRQGLKGQRRESVKAKAPAVARSGRIRLALLPLFAAAFLLLPSSAFAEIVVNLNGSGAGTVTSKPAGIECSNVGGGAAGPDCSQSFPIETSPGSGQLLEIKLAAKPDKGFYLAGWSGDDPDFFGVATCNTGNANPCTTTDLEEFGITPITITATFEPLPELPIANTGDSGPGANERLIELQGTVNPSEFKVSDCGFEYGLTDKYGSSAPCVPDAAGLGEGAIDVPVSAEVETEQLRPNATYHYRLVASNVAGTSEGEDRTFATAPVADGCANAAIRSTQALAAVLLPDCMALEMVSPPRKGGQAAYRPVVSAEGERVLFLSSAALGGTPGNVDVSGDAYVATPGTVGLDHLLHQRADRDNRRLAQHCHRPQLLAGLLALVPDRLDPLADPGGHRARLRRRPRRPLLAALAAARSTDRRED